MRRASIKDEWLEVRLFTSRTIISLIGVVLLAIFLISRLYWLQVTQHPHYATLSDDNRVRVHTLAPTRGLIFDRNGILLAENVPSYQLEIIPEQVPDMEALLAELTTILDLTPAEIERFEKLRQTKRRFQPVPLRYNLSELDVAKFAVHRHDLAGADIHARLIRRYPLGPIMAHVIGYIGNITEEELEDRDSARYFGTSQIGKVGIERAYEDALHGNPGIQQVETNAQSRILRVLDTQNPNPGRDLTLTIDAGLQKAAFDALEDYKGAVVALDPRNGEVLALVSKPGYNPNLFVDGIDIENYARLRDDKRQPLFNRAVVGTYPPGSTIKPMLGIAALDAGVVTSTHTTLCTGIYRLEGNPRPYRDWKRTGHGVVDLGDAIEQSCDVYFYELAVELGIDRIHEYLSRFGFGKATGIDLVGEAKGILPSREWKRQATGMPWFPGETVNIGIGQGFMTSTPLQLANATAYLANAGHAYTPHLLKSQRDSQGVENVVQPNKAPDIKLRGDWYWPYMANNMKNVVHGLHGSARATGIGAKYRIAGKTGTAQVFTLGEEEEYDAETLAKELRDHSLFVAFAPADDPQLVIAIVVENAGGGSAVAAPAARRIFDAWLKRKTP